MYRDYNHVVRSWPYVLRGRANLQTGDNFLWRPPRITMRSPGAYASPSEGQAAAGTEVIQYLGVGLGPVILHNRSGGAANVGIGVRIPNSYWYAGQWVDTTPAYTDDTADAQDLPLATADFELETTTNNDGFVVASRVPFNAVSIAVVTASVGSPVRAVRYSNATGDDWTNFANLYQQDASATNYSATAEQVIVFDPPADWGRTQTGGLSGIPQGLYAINVRATTAPTTAGVASAMEIYYLPWIIEGLADNGLYETHGGTGPEVFHESLAVGDGVVAYFGTANNQNGVRAFLRARG